MKTVCEIAAKLRRLPLGVSAPSIEKATTVCRQCGTGYVPAIARLHGTKRIVTRIRPCPKCGTYRETKVQDGIQYQTKRVREVKTWTSDDLLAQCENELMWMHLATVKLL